MQISLIASRTFYTIRSRCRSDGLQGHALLLMTRLSKRPSLSRFRVTLSSPSYATQILILFLARPATVRLYNLVTTSLGHRSRGLPRATKNTLECPSRSYRGRFYANKEDSDHLSESRSYYHLQEQSTPNKHKRYPNPEKNPIACQHHACNSYKFQIYPLPSLFPPLMLAALAVGIRMQYVPSNRTRGKAGKHG